MARWCCILPGGFTSGCTVEAHLFAEATDKFKALGPR
jgi:peroxiredoxin